MSTTPKRAFVAPKTGDPREIELAFELLNKKIDEITVKLDATLTGLSNTQDTNKTAADSSIADNSAAIIVNATAITANTTLITTNDAAQTAALAAESASITSAYQSADALKVDIDAAITDIGTLSSDTPVYEFTPSPIGDVSQSEWNNDIMDTINSEFTAVRGDISTMRTKVNAILAIIRDD